MLLAAFAVRLYRLGVASLWYDETVSVYLAQQDFAELVRHTAGDIHPPLYYLLLHVWGRLAGWSEFAMAFVSLCFGILLIALVYRVAREWFNVRVAWIAALLIAISPYNLWYSQEVRMYTLGAMLGLASVYFLVRLISRQLSVTSRQSIFSRDLIVYAIISALGLYTLYYFAFLLVFENLVTLVWLIRNSRSRLDLRFGNWKLGFVTWVFSQLAILILYLPWLPIAIHQAIDPPVPPWRSFIALPQVLLESFSALVVGQSIEPIVALPVLLIVGVIIVVAMLDDREQTTDDRQKTTDNRLQTIDNRLQTTDRRLTTDPSSLTTNHLSLTTVFLLGYTFIPLLIIYALSLWKPLYHVRYVFLYSPAFYILLALGIARIASRVSRFTFYALLLLFFGACAFSIYNFWFEPKYAKDDLRGAVNYLAEHWRPGDAILINAGYTYTAFVYYYDQPIAWRGRLTEYASPSANDGAIVLQTGSVGGAPNLGWGDPRSDFYATTADETRAALDRVFAAHPRVWMLRLYDTVVDPDGIIRDYLATRGRIIDDQGFAGESYARVQGYLTAPLPTTTLPSTITRRDVLLGNRIVLLGFEPASIIARAGATIDVNVYWQAKEQTNVDSHLFIAVYAEDGALVASTEEIPIGNALGTSRWTPGEILRDPIRVRLPAHLAPGLYNLRITLYNPLTNEPLSAPSNVADASQIMLTQIQIEK
jgi:mannosyltransferase